MPSSCARPPDFRFLRLVFAGTPEFAERSLTRLLAAGHDIALVLTQPDRPAGRGMRPMPSAVKRCAVARGLPVFQPANYRDRGDIARVREVGADAMVVAAYGLLLPTALLEATRHGAFNIHASLLPRWRGAAPIQRALLAGDAETGISVMQMDAGLDTGPVLAQRPIPIDARDDAGSLHDKLAELGAEMIVGALEDISNGRARPVPQASEGVTYARKLEKRETVLDWSKPAAQLERAVRAFRPAPGASTHFAGETIKIWRARVVSDELPPGALKQEAGMLIVGCGENALVVEELQRAGGKKLNAAEFLRGRLLPAEARFQ